MIRVKQGPFWFPRPTQAQMDAIKALWLELKAANGERWRFSRRHLLWWSEEKNRILLRFVTHTVEITCHDPVARAATKVVDSKALLQGIRSGTITEVFVGDFERMGTKAWVKAISSPVADPLYCTH